MIRICLAVLFALACAGCGRPQGPPAPQVSEISVTAAPATGEVSAPKFGDDDWPQWRGPNTDGVSTGSAVPVSWKDGAAPENIVWKQQVPGRGHSSPVIVGEFERWTP